MAVKIQSRRLWLKTGEPISPRKRSTNDAYNTYLDIFQQYATRPTPVSLSDMISNSVVVGQEFVLTMLFLAGHRTVSSKRPLEDWEKVAEKIQPSLIMLWFALFFVILHNKPNDTDDASRLRTMKIRHRTADGLFMAVLLRFLAAVLKTLTASYSSDTVHALAISGFALHLLACDYSYANGIVRGSGSSSSSSHPLDTTKRPVFQGGTLSLTSAFFATTLLASRLDSNVTVYIFVSSSVVLFALYPAARHQVAINTDDKKWVPMVISLLLAGAAFRLLSIYEVAWVLVTLITICGVVPMWKYVLQRQKITLEGPWVLVHPTTATTTETRAENPTGKSKKGAKQG